MNHRIIVLIAAVAAVLLFAAYQHKRVQLLRDEVLTLKAQVAAVKASAPTGVTQPVVITAVLNITNDPTGMASVSPARTSVAAPAPDTLPLQNLPVHVVTRKTGTHPGIAYAIYNDGARPLNIRVTLSNPLRMAKTFDGHIEPGPNSYCEIGFDQGVSGSRGDTLTIESANFIPLTVTP